MGLEPREFRENGLELDGPGIAGGNGCWGWEADRVLSVSLGLTAFGTWTKAELGLATGTVEVE